MSRPSHFGLIFLFFLCATTLYTYNLIFHLPHAAMVGRGDVLGDTALVAWNAHQLIQSPLHLFDSHFFYPHSNTLAYGQSAFFSGLLAAPLLAITGQPLLATNILMFLAFVLSGVFTYFLALSLTGRVVPSLLAGVVFAYFPNRMDHLGQFNVQMGAFVPLILWAFYRFLLESRWRDLLVTLLGIWALVLSAIYYSLPLQFLLLGFLASFFFLRPHHFTRSFFAKGAGGLLLLGVSLAPFLKPYLDVHRDLGLERDLGEADLYGMDLLSILDPGVFNKLYSGHLLSLGRPEQGMFPGFVVLGLGAFALWVLRRDSTEVHPRWVVYAGRILFVIAALSLAVIVLVPWSGGINLHWGPIRLLKVSSLTRPVALLPLLGLAWVGIEGRKRRSGPLIPREWVITLLFLTVLTYLLTLTPTLMVRGRPFGTALFAWVHDYVPGGSAFRAPGRWALVFALPLALLAAFGACAVGDRLRGRLLPGLVSVLLLLGLMAEYRCFPFEWERDPTPRHLPPPPVYHWLAEQPGDFAVLELPVDSFQPYFMFWGTVHWKRLVNGAIGFVPPTFDEIVNALDPFDAHAFVTRLDSIFSLRYLVVHEGLLPEAERVRWEGFRVAPIPGLQFVRSFDGDDVYVVSGTPQVGVDLRRYFPVDFVRHHPFAEYDLQFTGEDPEVKRWVEVTFNERRIKTRLTGGSDTIHLTPPYKAGDRNKLRFLHRYDLAEPPAGRRAYRIGRTTSHSPVDIKVTSAGKESGNTSSITVNGLEVSTALRGYNIVTLNPRTGQVTASEVFDTFKSRDESRRMGRFVERLLPGTIVVASVKDEASGQLTEEGVEALRAVGGREDIRGRLWVSHLLIGVKGARPGEALEASGPRRLSASVGRDRPLAMILRSFNLR